MFDLREVLGEAMPTTISIVDVGAMALGNSAEVYAPLLKAQLASVVGFEPVAEECAKLQSAAGPGHRYLPYAIGDGSRRTLHVCNFPMTSSLYEPNLPLVEKFQNLANLMHVVRRDEIETRRLDDVSEVSDVDFLKLDVQGAELDVINGAARTLGDTVCVHVEVEYVPLYKDQPLFAEVDQALRGNGFLLHRILGFAGRAFQPLVFNNNVNQPGSQHLWSDAVYVKDFMRLHLLSPQKLLKLATILHSVYQSVDLVYVVLKAHDEQSGTAYSSAYLQRLVGQVSAPAP